jgi:precorrin-6A/cobalt-precorrin-6A reductase
MRLLILGGTAEANGLANLLAQREEISAILSFAGRTRAPKAPPIPYRIGGFGGVDGLTAFLRAERIDMLIDATHPFAETISDHAVLASEITRIPLVCLSRPAWRPEPFDRWIPVASMEAAAIALGAVPKRVFLTIGRLQLAAFATAPQHFYLIRSIEPIEPLPFLPNRQVILGRGPFELVDERAILKSERIDMIVTKNSGGPLTFAKILAARQLGLKVIMVERKRVLQGQCAYEAAEVLALILQHQAGLAVRGV